MPKNGSFSPSVAKAVEISTTRRAPLRQTAHGEGARRIHGLGAHEIDGLRSAEVRGSVHDDVVSRRQVNVTRPIGHIDMDVASTSAREMNGMRPREALLECQGNSRGTAHYEDLHPPSATTASASRAQHSSG
jgi:hypothetical protein